FVFVSLAFAKRLSELLQQPEGRRSRRPYFEVDRTVVLAQACASAYTAGLVLCLYLNSPEVRQLYLSPGLLWLLVPLLVYWISRLLTICNRGQLHHDPVVFALRDRASRAVLGGVIIIVLVAKYL